MDDIVVLERFFAAYEDGFNRALGDPGAVDAAETAAAFADCFVEAGPRGVSCGRNDETFRDRIPMGYAFYRQIGIRAMVIRSLAPARLDERHWSVRVMWAAEYDREGTAGRIEFEVIYLLQMTDAGPRIFAYITGDEEGELRRHGLIGDADPAQGG